MSFWTTNLQTVLASITIQVISFSSFSIKYIFFAVMKKGLMYGKKTVFHVLNLRNIHSIMIDVIFTI